MLMPFGFLLKYLKKTLSYLHLFLLCPHHSGCSEGTQWNGTEFSCSPCEINYYKSEPDQPGEFRNCTPCPTFMKTLSRGSINCSTYQTMHGKTLSMEPLIGWIWKWKFVLVQSEIVIVFNIVRSPVNISCLIYLLLRNTKVTVFPPNLTPTHFVSTSF